MIISSKHKVPIDLNKNNNFQNYLPTVHQEYLLSHLYSKWKRSCHQTQEAWMLRSAASSYSLEIIWIFFSSKNKIIQVESLTLANKTS